VAETRSGHPSATTDALALIPGTVIEQEGTA
jgi:hypothetical protein